MHGAFPLPLVAAVSIPSPEGWNVAPSFSCRARGTTRRARLLLPSENVRHPRPRTEGATLTNRHPQMYIMYFCGSRWGAEIHALALSPDPCLSS